MKSILVLDDDVSQLNYMTKILGTEFKISTYNNSIEAYTSLKENHFDALIIDYHMPIINGLEFIKKIKNIKNFNSSLFILSSDSSSDTKIQALNLGIKDFLWPQMNKEELVLRIKNHLNFENSSSTNQLFKHYRDIQIDMNNMSASIKGQKIELTLIEFKILSYLIGLATNIVDRQLLKKFTWPDCVVLDKTLNTHLSNLRIKLINSQVEIKSIKGEGIILI